MKWNCGNCGAEIDEGTKFCPNCGTKINWETTDSGQGESQNMGITGILNAYVAYYGKKKIIAFFTVIIVLCVGVFIIKNSEKESPKFVAVENGRAAYKLIETHYENSDVKSINKIVMYNGNGRQDCKAEGVNGQGQLYSVDGKWEKKEISSRYDIYYYRLDFKYFQLIISEDFSVSYSKGDKKYEGNIGKIKELSQEDENVISEKFSKEMKKQEEVNRQEAEKQNKIKTVADMAYRKGYQCRRETWGDYNPSSESRARLEYTMRYGREPEEEGQSERWNVFKENYMKGFRDAADDIMKRKRQEDF